MTRISAPMRRSPRVTLQRLQIKPGDVLVVRFPKDTPPSGVTRLKRDAAAVMGTMENRVNIIVVPHDYKLHHLRQDAGNKLYRVASIP